VTRHRARGVLFDMDGLLLDTERLALDSFGQTARALGVPDIAVLGHDLIGLRADATAARIGQALDGRLAFATFGAGWDQRFDAALERGIPLKDGVIELLDQLARTGLPCAIATSTHAARAHKHLKIAGIAGYFQTVTGGDQVANGKPAPDIYHAAAASLGLTAPDCIAFEDSDPGATAAIASGARTVQIPDIKPPSPEMTAKGHIIAASLLQGARRAGLIAATG